jgi:D-alanine-D-alanine ligase
MPREENFFEYQAAPDHLQSTLRDITMKAFLAVKGTGYARVDIRMDQKTGKLLCLK